MIELLTVGFMLIDILTGLLNAFSKNEFKSQVMRLGLFHKFGSMIVIVLSRLIEFTSKYVDIGVDLPIAQTACALIILMEIGSILENVTKLNPELQPNFLNKIFNSNKE